MLRAVADQELDAILGRVSRSFYLSLAVLPSAVRTQLSVAYLLARAADTIADTEAVRPGRRRELLAGLRRAIDDAAAGPAGEREAAAFAAALRREITGPGQVAEERLLLERLGDCLRLLRRFEAGDLARTRRVLAALATGMERDLARFDGVHLVALATLADLDEHCYLAAGCVGEYWTEMTAAHLPAVAHLRSPDLVRRGVRLGKALQLVNVLRDAPVDLAHGRCYVPAELLERHRLAPEDLRDPRRRLAARPVLDALRALALDHVDAAWGYVEAIPPSAPRLRLACVWPLWIGLSTLARLAALPDPLDPSAPRKITRGEVYRLVAESSATVMADPLLHRLHRRRRRLAAA